MDEIPDVPVPQNTQELISTLLHQTMLVFNSLKDLRLTEPDENRHKMRIERIAASSHNIVQTFSDLRENCAALDSHTGHIGEEEREKRARDIMLNGREEKEEGEKSYSALEKEKEELEKELDFYNDQLKEIIDDTRTLISDVNSIQFYS